MTPQIECLIDRSPLIDAQGRWKDPRGVQAELTALLRALVAAFPGAKVNVTTHRAPTVLQLSAGVDRGKAEALCAQSRLYSRSQSSPAEASTPPTTIAAARTAKVE